MTNGARLVNPAGLRWTAWGLGCQECNAAVAVHATPAQIALHEAGDDAGVLRTLSRRDQVAIMNFYDKHGQHATCTPIVLAELPS
jgi:hypothetical protein